MLHCDNRSAVDMSVDPIAFRKTKHILRAANFVRDLVARRYIEVRHIPGENNVADLMTKPVTRPVFIHMLSLLADPTLRPSP